MRKARDAGLQDVINMVTAKNRLTCPPKEDNKILSTYEVAAMLDEKIADVCKYASKVIGIQIGKCWYVRAEQLDDVKALLAEVHRKREECTDGKWGKRHFTRGTMQD